MVAASDCRTGRVAGGQPRGCRFAEDIDSWTCRQVRRRPIGALAIDDDDLEPDGLLGGERLQGARQVPHAVEVVHDDRDHGALPVPAALITNTRTTSMSSNGNMFDRSQTGPRAR